MSTGTKGRRPRRLDPNMEGGTVAPLPSTTTVHRQQQGHNRQHHQLHKSHQFWPLVQLSTLVQSAVAIVSQLRPSQKGKGQTAASETPSTIGDSINHGPINHGPTEPNMAKPARQRTSAAPREQLLARMSAAGIVRMGILALMLVLLWWTWPTAPVLPTDQLNFTGNALAMAANRVAEPLRPLAIETATDGQTTENAAAGTDQRQTILIPTAVVSRDPGGTVQEAGNRSTNSDSSNGTASNNGVVSMQVESNPVVAGLNALTGILRPTSTPARVDESVDRAAIPQIEVLPGVSIQLPFGQPTLTPTPTPAPTPTPVPINLTPGRRWSTFTPAADSDHFWVGRAFRAGATQLASPSYQFGSTAGDRYRTHHGVDISNPQGTPILAAAEGVVVHAGPDDTILLGPYHNFYGNVVAIRLDRQLSVAGGQMDVFLLYGHLSQVTVGVGDRVRPEDVVGMVGMTGIAIGPHLHVEVRLGANTYFNNVNPFLWMKPLEGHGAVAVRVLTADGRTWPGAYVSLVRYAGGTAAWARQIVTYMDVENIGPDPAWGENGAMDGVPAGRYYVIGIVNGERLSTEIEVRAGQTSFVELRTRQ